MAPISASAPATGPIVYYRDPDGRPAYSAIPTRTADGRDFVAVRASEDVTFDEEAPKPAAAGNKRILYYRNPMGLPDVSSVPKKDSMGMDYLPVYAGEEDDETTVKVSPGKLQRAGVRTEVVQSRTVSRPVVAPARIALDDRRVAVVSLRSEAFIEQVEPVTVGDRVRKGQPLLRLYSPDIAAASAQYLSVVNDGGANARTLLLASARRRLENLNVPPDAILEIERTRKVPATIAWPAPRDGVILERNAVDGMRAAQGEVLFRLADTSLVWVLADVAERDVSMVRLGQAASIKVRSLPGREFAGRVTVVYPQIEQQSRTVRVRVELPNPDGSLLPAMYAEAEFANAGPEAVPAVPESAIIETGESRVVLVDRGEGRFEPRSVEVGARGGGYVEIRNGLEAGDRVVVSANFLIDAESNLKAALRAFAPPAAETK